MTKNLLLFQGIYVSGLQLEYNDSRIPIVLGQWVRELDVFDLSPGDRITELTTWHDYTNQNKRAKIGLVRRLRLGAVFGATKAFLEPYISGMICLQYRESRYEKLSGILWGCNHEWDHVRIFHTPKLTDRASTLLVDSGTYSPPSWMVIQKVFAQGGLDDGCTTPLSSIEVTFKEMTSEVSGVTMIYEDGSSSTLGVRGEPRIIYLASGEKPAQVEIVAARDN